MKPIIEVNHLSKRYRIGTKQSYYSFRDTLTDLAKSPFRKKSNKSEFWALKDVSFKVMPGEVVGIIGRNGAGKSTLLKILSRITPPTKGDITLRGRVASLLEVGTGFHPELTGRENIYLNGAILGMKRIEINAKFAEIVEFAEISKFLDTPVKFYSSGMYMRLAFAIAAHLDPEILLVDEVLAVGDVEFQKKCLGKMSEVSKQGRTVIVVSHNLGLINNLCKRTIFLKNGRILIYADSKVAIEKYFHDTVFYEKNCDINLNNREGTNDISLTKIKFQDDHGNIINNIISGQDTTINIEYKVNNKSLKTMNLSIGIDNEYNQQRVAYINNKIINHKISLLNNNISILIKNTPLNQGKYNLTIFIESEGNICDWVKNAKSFEVLGGNFYKTGLMPPVDQGSILLDYSIQI